MSLFTKRESSAERRRQIVEAALRLLAEVPLSSLTTRQIAREVGLTQPALFRHFHTKEELLRAVVDDQRERLGKALLVLFREKRMPLDRIEALFALLLRHAGENPGLVRLLLADAAAPGFPGLHRALDILASTKLELVASLLRKAQADGSVPAQVDVRAAAQLFVTLIQGTLLMRLRAGVETAHDQDESVPLKMWLAALRAGCPAREEEHDAHEDEHEDAREDEGPAFDPVVATGSERLVALDVRPILAEGRDPLGTIEAQLERLAPVGAMLLTAPFAPHPLMHLLSERGYRLTLEEREPGVFSVLICAPDAPELVDLSSLPAPEPLEGVLVAVAALAEGGAMLFRVPRRPELLLPRLSERGCTCLLVEHDDGAALLHVTRSRTHAQVDSVA